MHTQNHDISRTIKLAGSWPLAIRTENKKTDCQLVIHTALQNKSPNRQTLFIACVFAPEIYFLIKKKKSSRSIHLTNVNPLKDNSDMLCRWLFHFINVLQTGRKSEGKIYFSHGISVCFFMGRKKNRIKAFETAFMLLIVWDAINLVGLICFDFWGVWLEIIPGELFSGANT